MPLKQAKRYISCSISYYFAESMCITIENITCKLNLKGISFSQDLTQETENEGNKYDFLVEDKK